MFHDDLRCEGMAEHDAERQREYLTENMGAGAIRLPLFVHEGRKKEE